MDKFLMRLDDIDSQVNNYFEYYGVQHNLQALRRMKDNYGVIKYSFYKNSVCDRFTACKILDDFMGIRRGHEIISASRREFYILKHYRETYVRVLIGKLSDGSYYYDIDPVTNKTVSKIIDNARKLYLHYQKVSMSNHLAQFQYNFAKGTLERKGVKKITFPKVANELIKENKIAQTAKVPF